MALFLFMRKILASESIRPCLLHPLPVTQMLIPPHHPLIQFILRPQHHFCPEAM